MLVLRPIEMNDYEFLYEMLKERTPEQSISFRMPRWMEHVSFVRSKPYTQWYIIEFNGQRVGNIYLTKNDELGYFVKKECHGKGIGTQAIKKIMELHPKKHYLMNVNPRNKKGIHMAEKFGGKLVQLTYKT